MKNLAFTFKACLSIGLSATSGFFFCEAFITEFGWGATVGYLAISASLFILALLCRP